MTYSVHQQFLTLALAVGQFVFADSPCNSTATNSSPFDNGYNATGSVSTPGFRVNDSYPESTWTWSRYIVDDYNNTTNRSSVWQTFGLQTSPVQNLTDPTLSYTACVIALSDVKVAGNAASDNGSCNSVLTSDCVRQIIAQVNTTASQFSASGVGSSSSFSCPSLLGSISISSGSACHGQWSGSFSARFMPRNFTAYPPTACGPVPNPGSSNSSTRTFFSWGGTSTAADNYTIYDQTIRTPQPIIVAAFLKDTGAMYPSNVAWADTRLLCLPGNVTTLGNRNITETNRAAGAGRVGGVSLGMFGLVALTALLSFL